MSSDTWSDIQAHKNKQSSLREKLARRKQERQAKIGSLIGPESGSPGASTGASASPTGHSTSTPTVVSSQSSGAISNVSSTSIVGSPQSTDHGVTKPSATVSPRPVDTTQTPASGPQLPAEVMTEVERHLLLMLSDITLILPMEGASFTASVGKQLNCDVPQSVVDDLLQKFSAQMLLCLETDSQDKTGSNLIVSSVDHNKLDAVANEMEGFEDINWFSNKRKKDLDAQNADKQAKKPKKTGDDEDFIESLLSKDTAKQRESKKMSDEILQLLSKPTAKEQSLIEKFKSQGGAQVKEFCPNGTKEECARVTMGKQHCGKLHFRKIIHKHTDESLGDCSFLNTCFHMDMCKYVHYEIDYPEHAPKRSDSLVTMNKAKEGSTILFPPQWIQCDLRSFDMMVLGKFAIVMADPPWDIHMELPYGTMSDDEMRKLQVPVLQDEGIIFLWVTGRAMELGRECLQLWGYERMDELIWVKTNQLQRIIRTGRTGHWLNHGKEHCLVGVKGNPKSMNRGLDCDVIVAEVRATSHKPDEIYGIIERLSPGTRKIELFGRPHNVQPNWFTLGNQLDGVKLNEPDVVKAFKARYPNGC